MLTLNNIAISFNGDFLFKNISFTIKSGDRIGLIGKNGAGKSTLLKIITKELSSEGGEIIAKQDIKIGYLPQEPDIDTSKSVFEEAKTAFAEVNELNEQITHLTNCLSEETDHLSTKYQKIIEQLSSASERLGILDASTIEESTEKVLKGLGFEDDEIHKAVRELSFGWQMRVEIAKVLLQKPDLLLLDEPINHLDIESIMWLEQFLSSYPGAVVIIAHDRTFLDTVVNRTIEISLGKIYDFKTNYTGFFAKKDEIIALQSASYENQQKQIKDTERFINRFRAQATKAKQVQSKIKLLEKMEIIEIEETDNSALHFRFPPAPPSGKVTVIGETIGKSYGQKRVIDNLDISINRGEKVCFLGKNGEGKSTLINIISGKLEHEGVVTPGHNVEIGYFAQNHADFLDGDKTVYDTIDDIATGEKRKLIRSILGAFLFSDDAIDKKVKILSGGEKARLSLSKLMFSTANFIILDEPTNHLDLRSKEILKKALIEYEGTLLIVSHDRNFLDGLVNKIYEFRNHKIRQFSGDINDFTASRKISSLKELEFSSGKKSTKNSDVALSGKDNKAKYQERKQYEKELRKIKNRISSSEKNIEKLEKQLAELENQLAQPDIANDAILSEKLYKEYGETKTLLSTEMNNWEKHNQRLENL